MMSGAFQSSNVIMIYPYIVCLLLRDNLFAPQKNVSILLIVTVILIPILESLIVFCKLKINDYFTFLAAVKYLKAAWQSVTHTGPHIWCQYRRSLLFFPLVQMKKASICNSKLIIYLFHTVCSYAIYDSFAIEITLWIKHVI